MRKGRAIMADEMKVQNCPLCKQEPYCAVHSTEDSNATVCCSDLDCFFSKFDFTDIELWNRLRLAPNDRKLSSYSEFKQSSGLNGLYTDSMHGKWIKKRKWMSSKYPDKNPRYPDDS